MDATEALHLLRQLGLTLTATDGRLIVTPAELLDDDTRCFIRSHRDAIIAELEQADSPRWAWLVRMSDGRTVETYHFPDATASEVMRKYPDALSVAPLPECFWPHDSAQGAA